MNKVPCPKCEGPTKRLDIAISNSMPANHTKGYINASQRGEFWCKACDYRFWIMTKSGKKFQIHKTPKRPRRLTDMQVLHIRDVCERGVVGSQSIAKRFGISRNAVKQVLSYHTYKHVKEV